MRDNWTIVQLNTRFVALFLFHIGSCTGWLLLNDYRNTYHVASKKNFHTCAHTHTPSHTILDRSSAAARELIRKSVNTAVNTARACALTCQCSCLTPSDISQYVRVRMHGIWCLVVLYYIGALFSHCNVLSLSLFLSLSLSLTHTHTHRHTAKTRKKIALWLSFVFLKIEKEIQCLSLQDWHQVDRVSSGRYLVQIAAIVWWFPGKHFTWSSER